jgi:hypothetical protein
MIKALRPMLLGAALFLAGSAARAQPARQERSARCRAAALKYLGPSPDKKHLTVEEESEYEHRGAKKYLSLCGDSDDPLTRSVALGVTSYEGARTLERLLPAVGRAGSPESKDPNAYAILAGAYEAQLALLMSWSRVAADAAAVEGYKKEMDGRTDLLIDAYARAVAACGVRADCQAQKDAWTRKLTDLYRSRHGGSDAGLRETIEGALGRPLPKL